ncbi:MAG: c-type cytochrome [Verrucomicrobiales bacterium]|nr:c-type cytochrome [Verrucomicrobiales bacterium]
MPPRFLRFACPGLPGRFSLLVLAGSLALMIGGARAQTPAQAPFPETPPTPPEVSAGRVKLLHGFRLELIAAEPLVTDPVDIAYDEDGRAYVAEMNDYPYTDKASHKPNQENPTDAAIGKIRLLVDSDDDGVFDRSTVFAEGLSWPTGVACWKGGIFVTATPDLWYLKDHDGDGVADERRKVYTGFRKLNVQALINNPIWGLDNHFSISGSTNGGTVTKVDDPAAPPLTLSRHDLRLDPRTETLSLDTGHGRFGNAYDDLGHRFVCNIRNPALHIVLPKHYLDRNPLLPATDARQDICGFGDYIPVHRISPPEAWRVERAQRWSVTEAAKHPSTELVGAGAVTSSCGITIYRGDAWPESWRGQLFVADVASNLFFRLELERDGMTFRATRPDTEADFAASEDVWFRPVNFENAPDGCLHVLDMYREAIEHPWSIPDDLHARVDLRRGMDRGRIYRLVPPGDFQRRPTPRLSQASAADLVKLLDHANAWHRETAQRLLVERQDQAAVEPLRKLLADDYGSELGRIHALRTLEGMGALRSEDLLKALESPEPGLKTHAVMASEPFLKANAPLKDALSGLANEREASVLAYALMALAEIDSERAKAFAIKAAPQIEADPWLRLAALSAAEAIAKPLAMNRSMGIRTSSGQLEYVYQLARMAGASQEAVDLHDYLLLLMDVMRSHAEFGDSRRIFSGAAAPVPEVALCALAGLRDGLKSQKVDLFSLGEELPVVKDLAALAEKALAAATVSPQTDAATYRLALSLLPPDSEATAPALLNLLASEVPSEVQLSALRTLGGLSTPAVGASLVSAFSGMTPAMQQQTVEVLLSRTAWVPPLLEAIEIGQISPHYLSRARRDQLIAHADAAIADRARALFAGKADREQAIRETEAALASLTPDATAGQAVFQQFCLACHRAGEEGFSEIGPNLATVRAWDRGQILTNLLDPNREVSPDFAEYLVEKRDGTVVSGTLVSETEAAVLLKRPDGSRESVPRRDIQSVRNSGHSVMPEGLEAVMTPQQIADVIAWLTTR